MMRLRACCATFLLYLLCGAVAAPLAELDAAGLVNTLATQSVVLQLYTRWCDLCRAYQPELERVAAAFEGLQGDQAGPLLFARVDVDAHPEVAASFGVRSVPFLTLLRAGAWFSRDHQGEPVPLPPARYEGPLTAGATAAWLANSTGLSVAWRPHVEELTPETLQRALDEGDQELLVEFYGASCGRCQEFEAAFESVGARFADTPGVRVGRIDVHAHRELVAAHQLSGLPSFTLFPRGAHRHRGLPFSGARSAPALVAFVLSPQVERLQADVRALGAGCATALVARGTLPEPPPGAPVPVPAQRAQQLLHAAHAAALEGRWRNCLETLLCLTETPQLRNTAAGSSPALWNLMDNAKAQLERDAGRGGGLEGGAESEATQADAGTDFEHPDDDPWARFQENAERRRAAQAWGEVDEL